jgi:hypothetical protein
MSHRPEVAAEDAARIRRSLGDHWATVGFILTENYPATGIERGLRLIRIGCSTHFVALIDPEWEPGGPHDVLTEEVSSALRAGHTVRPVLIRGAHLPSEARLPQSIRGLLRHRPHKIREETWASDVKQLAEQLLPGRIFNAPQFDDADEPLPHNGKQVREPSEAVRRSGFDPAVRLRAVAFAERALRLVAQAVEEADLGRAVAILREIWLDAPTLRSERASLEAKIEELRRQQLPRGREQVTTAEPPSGSYVLEILPADLVKCTIFAPPVTTAGDAILVQVFAHLPRDARMVHTLANTFDSQASARAAKFLDQQVGRGTPLTFSLSIPGIVVEDPTQSIVWRGLPDAVQFVVKISKGHAAGRTIGTVVVSQESVPFGHLKFILEVVDNAVTTPPERASSLDQVWTRYRHAFVSYASEDRVEVLKRVQMLDRTGIGYFQDLLSLDPGERWERTLYRKIDESDVFFLFWSTAAKNSECVMKEVRYAIELHGGDEMAPPEIVPVLIEGPPPVAPPPELKDLHFNDRFLYFIAGS